MTRSSLRWLPISVTLSLILSACSAAMLEPGLAAEPTSPVVALVPDQAAPQATPIRPTPSTPVEALEYAEQAFARGDMEGAITYYTEVIRYSPRDADSHYRRGLAHHGRGDLDRAISDYDVSLQIDNGHAIIYCDRGLAYDQKGNREQAVGNFRACHMMASDPDTETRAEGYLRERGVEP